MQIMLPVFGTEEEPSPSALYENDDVVTINVFDEVINERPAEPRVARANEWVAMRGVGEKMLVWGGVGGEESLFCFHV